MEVLQAIEAKHLFQAYALSAQAFKSLEDVGIFETEKNTPQALSAYDQAVESYQQAAAEFFLARKTMDEELALVESAGLEPGFQASLLKLDYEALRKRL